MAAGGILWETTLGRLLRPIFFLFWQGIFRLLGFPFAVLRLILKPPLLI
jgi:hypothetical protein